MAKSARQPCLGSDHEFHRGDQVKFQHGLVVGKFYPPHLGHLRLIRIAADRCEKVTVVVAASSCESLSLSDRVEWLGWDLADIPRVVVVGAMDDHDIDYDDPAAWDAHVAVFRGAVDEVGGGVAVDAVFTGEPYGDELARRFQATHIRIDRDDGRSGTNSRDDLVATWLDLSPATRTSLARRVVVLGAESTGTTTLASSLAGALGVQMVGEFGRTYSAAKVAAAREHAHHKGLPAPWINDVEWTDDEFTQIAFEQTAAIDGAARQSHIVVADTDAIATSVWHERYIGGPHDPALVLSRRHPAHLYLLTSPDGVAFHQDGLRDGEHVRGKMTERFRTVLEENQIAWQELRGGPEERLEIALSLCESALAPPVLAPPLS